MSVGHQLIPIIFTKQPSKFELAIQKWFHKKSHDTYFPQLKETSCDVMYGFFILPKIQNQPFIGILQNSCSENLRKLSGKHCVKCVQIRGFSWSVFFRIRTEYGEIRNISPYSVRMRENTDQKKLCIWTLFRALKNLVPE